MSKTLQTKPLSRSLFWQPVLRILHKDQEA